MLEAVSVFLLEPIKNTVVFNTSLSFAGVWNRGPLKVLDDSKLIINDQEGHSGPFRIIHNLQRSPIPQVKILLNSSGQKRNRGARKMNLFTPMVEL